MDSVISETWITLDSRLFSQDVVVLSLEVANNLAKGGLVVNLVAEAGCVNDSQRDSCSLFVQLKLYTMLDCVFRL